MKKWGVFIVGQRQGQNWKFALLKFLAWAGFSTRRETFSTRREYAVWASGHSRRVENDSRRVENEFRLHLGAPRCVHGLLSYFHKLLHYFILAFLYVWVCCLHAIIHHYHPLFALKSLPSCLPSSFVITFHLFTMNHPSFLRHFWQIKQLGGN